MDAASAGFQETTEQIAADPAGREISEAYAAAIAHRPLWTVLGEHVFVHAAFDPKMIELNPAPLLKDINKVPSKLGSLAIYGEVDGSADATGRPIRTYRWIDKVPKGVVVHVETREIEEREGLVEVAAGEPWDAFVETCVDRRLSGVECLAGIPGLVGATPMQNVGAYGQEVKDTIVRVRVWDREEKQERTLDAAACRFSYRSSFLKDHAARFVVLSVAFGLRRSDESAPVRYVELARALGIGEGESAPLAKVRETVMPMLRHPIPRSAAGPSASSRDSIVGTRATEVTASRSRATSVRSASKCGSTMTVPPSDSTSWVKNWPAEW